MVISRPLRSRHYLCAFRSPRGEGEKVAVAEICESLSDAGSGYFCPLSLRERAGVRA